jgi:hypothetical protein
MRKKRGAGNTGSTAKDSTVQVVGHPPEREDELPRAVAANMSLQASIKRIENYANELAKLDIPRTDRNDISTLTAKYLQPDEFDRAKEMINENLEDLAYHYLVQLTQDATEIRNNIEKLLKELPDIRDLKGKYLVKQAGRRRKTNRRKR